MIMIILARLLQSDSHNGMLISFGDSMKILLLIRLKKPLLMGPTFADSKRTKICGA